MVGRHDVGRAISGYHTNDFAEVITDTGKQTMAAWYGPIIPLLLGDSLNLP
jgi:hypothetical protein